MRQSKHYDRAIPLHGRGQSVRPAIGARRLHEATAVAQPTWRKAYVRRIMASDAGCAILASTVCYATKFGSDTAATTAAASWIALALPVVWVLTMSAARTYEHRFLWEGPDEYRRVFFAAVLLLATVATGSWAVDLEAARGFVVVALPLATVTTLVERVAWRERLRFRRRQGSSRQRTLLVGHLSGVNALHAQITRTPHAGYEVIGCCLPSAVRTAVRVDGELPVLGNFDDVVGVVRRHEVDTVAVMPSPEWDSEAVRSLGWALEETSAELLLAPTLSEIVGPRVQLRPMCGLPLLHLAPPELSGARRLTKGLLDRCAATVGLVLLVPVLLAIALAVKATSPGHVLFRQTRVGRDGSTFEMLKFRTMVAGADRMGEVLATRNDGNGVLFKLRQDPRVTPVGRVLRRYSLDELPQLFNVVRGEMSLVGPRPPLPAEVGRYGQAMQRRLLVKPGLTGLWQISGRSDLSWDDSVRIDVMYVENWSLGFDLMILWRTLGAVLRGSGAY